MDQLFSDVSESDDMFNSENLSRENQDFSYECKSVSEDIIKRRKKIEKKHKKR